MHQDTNSFSSIFGVLHGPELESGVSLVIDQIFNLSARTEELQVKYL